MIIIKIHIYEFTRFTTSTEYRYSDDSITFSFLKEKQQNIKNYKFKRIIKKLNIEKYKKKKKN